MRDLQSKNQELQKSNQELAQCVAAVVGISPSYGDRMTQILSTQAKQEMLVRDYQRELKDVASSVADRLKMSNHKPAKCFGAVEMLTKNYATIASRLNEWDKWYATPTGPTVVFLPEASAAPETLPVKPTESAPVAPMGTPPGVSGGGCSLPFSHRACPHCIYHPDGCADSGWAGGGGGGSNFTGQQTKKEKTWFH